MLKLLSFFKLETGFVLLLITIAGIVYPHWSNNSANGYETNITATTAKTDCPPSRMNVHDN